MDNKINRRFKISLILIVLDIVLWFVDGFIRSLYPYYLMIGEGTEPDTLADLALELGNGIFYISVFAAIVCAVWMKIKLAKNADAHLLSIVLFILSVVPMILMVASILVTNNWQYVFSRLFDWILNN